MKTTIDIADSLLQRAKEVAAKRGTTLKALVEEALRQSLDRGTGEEPTLEVHTFEGRGLQPGLSWGDWSSIRDLAYEGRGG